MKFTIVGYWADNDQPWVEHAEGKNAQEAAARAVAEADNADDLIVVEAFKGSIKAQLCNVKATTIDRMEYEL